MLGAARRARDAGVAATSSPAANTTRNSAFTYVGDGWAPTTLPLESAAVETSTLLLSHIRATARKDAAYALALFGKCAAASQVTLLTAAALLHATQPIFPVVAMLGERCWESALPGRLQEQGTMPLRVPEIHGVKCSGQRYGPGSRRLAPDANMSYFDDTYTILAAWNLTQYRAVLVLDSDLLVRRSLDHVLLTMLARPEIAEARTPEGCLDAALVEPTRGNFFNTGVWGVRPDALVYSALVHFLKSGTREHQCGIGIQTAAKGFFSSGRIDTARFDATRDCCPEWRRQAESEERKNALAAAGLAAGPAAAIRRAWGGVPPPPPGPSAYDNVRRAPAGPSGPKRLQPWEILRLHTGYNMKADQGVLSCLRRHGQSPNASHVVHWSGTRKPVGLDAQKTIDAIEYAAHGEYVEMWCNVASMYPLDTLPERQAAFCAKWKNKEHREQRQRQRSESMSHPTGILHSLTRAAGTPQRPAIPRRPEIAQRPARPQLVGRRLLL